MMLKEILTEGGILKVASLTSVGIAATTGINGWSIPLFGVPITVLAMAAGGATIAFAYGEPVKSRKRLFTLAVANTFIAAISVAVVPEAFGWEWVSDKLEPPLAGLVAVASRWVVPSFIELVPEVLRKLFRLEKYDKTYSGGGMNDYSDYYDQGDSKDYYEPEVKRRANKRK